MKSKRSFNNQKVPFAQRKTINFLEQIKCLTTNTFFICVHFYATLLNLLTLSPFPVPETASKPESHTKLK